MKKTSKNTKKGFTLIELIVVIAILGILAAVLLPRFSGFTDDARIKSALSEANNCYTAMSTYYAEHGKYPTVATDLKSLSTKLQGKMTINVNATSGKPDDPKNLFLYKDDPTTSKVEVKVEENGTLNVTKS